MKLESYHSAEEKAKWKIVRADSLADVPCDEIVSADEDTGECKVRIKGEEKTLSFGPGGIRVVGKR